MEININTNPIEIETSTGFVPSVYSVFGREGDIVAEPGDYDTSKIPENTNLYYTDERVNANDNVAANTAARHAALTLGTKNGLELIGQQLSLALASALSNGALSASDWNNFNNKLSSISGIAAGGELAGNFPSPTLLNSAVINKLLTGLNLVGGGTVLETDSILAAFGKVQNQISALVGGVMYKGIWNASTNSPSITSSVGNKGDYYIVSVAGSSNINGISAWSVGDWIIYNGSRWDKVNNTDAVSSVNGQVGAVNIAIPTNNNQLTNGAAYITNAVVGPILATSFTWTDTINNTGYLAIRSMAAAIGAANNLVFETGGVEAARFNLGRLFGIGITNPSYQLHLSTDSAAKPTSALWTIASDARIKENITPYNKGLAELLFINPVTYDYNGKGGFAKGKGGVGIIAQEIVEILPDSVSSVKGTIDDQETDILNFNGHELTYILINSIKELKAEIEQLKIKLNEPRQ